jgi:hypothetical protein
LFKCRAPERRVEDGQWEEIIDIQPQARWWRIEQEVKWHSDPPFLGSVSKQEIEAMPMIPAVVFLGVTSGNHQCRPATEEELMPSALPALRHVPGMDWRLVFWSDAASLHLTFCAV